MDGTVAHVTTKYASEATSIKNLRIRDCVIDNATKDNTGNGGTAIYIQGGENIDIQFNTINYAKYNGVQISSPTEEKRKSRGIIRIWGNNFIFTGNASIRVDSLLNAYLHIVDNKITSCGISENYSNYLIYVSNLTNSTYAFERLFAGGHNYYQDTKMEIGNGIIVLNVTNYASQDNLNNHVSDTSNPHMVTPEQIGAAPSVEVGNRKEIGYLIPEVSYLHGGCYFDVNSNFISQKGCSCYEYIFTNIYMGRKLHIKTYMHDNMAIVHDVTSVTNNVDIEKNPESGIFEYEYTIPKAKGTKLNISFCENPYIKEPEIYVKTSLWEEMSRTHLSGYCADCYAITEGGLYYIDSNTLNKPEYVTGSASLFVQPIATTNGTDIYLTLKSGANIVHCYYSSFAKAWQPWEWENPPMETVWTEYRTTERFRGKPVYTTMVGLGTLTGVTTPNTHFMGHKAKSIQYVIRATATMNEGKSIPNNSATVYADKGNVFVVKSTDETFTLVMAQIWYTKTTD